MPAAEALPHACDERPLTLAVSGWEVPAALTLPAGARAGAELPGAVLLVPGSLFSDVNGDYPTWNLFPHVYAHLARQLSARGLAVYRFAKMGPGTGSVAVDEAASRAVRNWGGRLVVARAALAAMRRALDALGVRAARTVVAGHSEGAVVASQLAAAAPEGATVDGVVLLAGPSVGILGIMREQMATFFPPDELAGALADFDAAVAGMRRDGAIPETLRARPALRGLASMPPDGVRYMLDSDAADPAALAAALPQPVLIVQGGRDPNVPPHHAERLRAARDGAGGARPTETLVVPELQHML
ncbi:MAG TPA: alpha/beta fold hydrolase, partial [Gemmatimonadaceae bacterium]|nr:alpha/beta fold hydrolase [Gemmatimonadaceae bacterium]